MSRVPAHASRGRPRAGLSVVEVLVALVVVSVGLLGMAGTSALSLRTATSAAREWRAVRRLELRLAALAAAGCTGAATGSAGALEEGDGVRERWTEAAPLRGAALVEVAADWRDGARVRETVLRSAILC